MTSNNGFRRAPEDAPRATISVESVNSPVIERGTAGAVAATAATAGAVVGRTLVLGGALAFLTAATLAVTVGGHRSGGTRRRPAHGKAPEARARNRTSLSRADDTDDDVDAWMGSLDPQWPGTKSAPFQDDYVNWPGSQPSPPRDSYPTSPGGGRAAARREPPPAQYQGPSPWQQAASRPEPVPPTRAWPSNGNPPAAQGRDGDRASSSGSMRQYNPPPRPAGQYNPPSGPMPQYNPPSGPMPQYGHPSGPMPQYNPPSGPMPQYNNHPSGPMRQYNPPSGPMPQYGHPSGPMPQYNPPSGAMHPYDPSPVPVRQFNPPSAPVRQYGAPPGQAVQYAGGQPVQFAGEGPADQLDRLGRESGKLWNVDSVRLANQILSTANQQAAKLRQEAETQVSTSLADARRQAEELVRQAAEQASAKIAAAEREVAEIQAAVLKLSTELSEVASHFTTNLLSPAKPATRPRADPPAVPKAQAAAAVATAPALTEPVAAPTAKPVRPATKPAARTASVPATRPGVSPRRSKPATQTDGKPKNRQINAARKMTAAVAVLALAGAITGATEVALHGPAFFVFRANGAGASLTGPNEDQGPGQPDAPGAHHNVKAIPAKAKPVKAAPKQTVKTK
jgi:hypothetical protein